MVGRLVEQQKIGLGEQRRGECCAHPPAAGEARERPRLRRLIEAQAVQDGARPRRRRMGADVGEPGLDLGDRGGILDPLGRREQALALGVGGEHRLARAQIAARSLLRDRADPRAAPQPHLAGVRRQLAPDQPQQRGLAAAVAPDQADPAPGRQMHGRTLEQGAAADPQGHIVEMQHGGRGIARAVGFAQRPRNGSVGCGRPRSRACDESV